MFTWIVGLWEKFKPVVKGTIMSLIRNKLKPEIVKLLNLKKQEIINELQNYPVEENADKACSWLEEYFDRQL